MRLARPNLPRPGVGIVHLGPGAFFRAFGAIYTAEAMAAKGGDWGIVGVSLRNPDVKDALGPQGCAYTATELSAKGRRSQVITVIDDVLWAVEDPAAVLDVLGDPRTRIVSLTVTEKGYCHVPATGMLDMEQADVAHDITSPLRPKTSVGFIVAALARRMENGHRPFTVLSCDNLPNNGSLVKGLVLQMAAMQSPDLAHWIEANARFPATMVDRITPATTPEDIATLQVETGYLDKACVLHEPFRQWVIEDCFVDDQKPAWETAGAQFVTDVAPFEAMKLRCLNGAHSTLAYLGYLGGHKAVSDASSDPVFERALMSLWRDEIIPTLQAPPGTDLGVYCETLLQRFQNPAIRHLTWQIAMDGSQKLPQRLLGTIADNLAAGRPAPLLIHAVAGWMRYIRGFDESGADIDVRDPFASELKRLSDLGATVDDKVQALLGVESIFAPSLRDSSEFCAALRRAYELQEELGTKGALQQVTA